MSEIKLTEGIDAELAALQSSGDSLATIASMPSVGNLSLRTSNLYVQQQEEIYKLLVEYRELILKDASDLQAMAKSVRTVDQNIATNT